MNGNSEEAMTSPCKSGSSIFTDTVVAKRSDSFPPYPPLCNKHKQNAVYVSHQAYIQCPGPSQTLIGDPFFGNWDERDLQPLHGLNLPSLTYPPTDKTLAHFLADLGDCKEDKCIPPGLKPTPFPPGKYKETKPLVEDMTALAEAAYVPTGDQYAKTFDPLRIDPRFLVKIAAETADSLEDLLMIPDPMDPIWRTYNETQ